ncbi:unnamed protein product [Soboliphyme baturini]|uniref:G_PROTEIN_RECEP_F1_2 domain-containing protein n=1 Tax=Soboliphyme baturini TaxID=241478 RepID=A0A183IJ35_9BILA|nr:unnamed protein product [Soboliphyme baturini]
MPSDHTTIAISQQLNNTISVDAPDEWWHDVVVVVIWTVAAIYGLLLNILTVFAVFRNRTMRRTVSYWFVLSLAFCDILMLVICLVHVIPASALHDNFVEVSETRSIVFMFLYDVVWYTGVIQLGVVAINRFISIIFPTSYKRLFCPSNTYVIVAMSYAVGIVVSVPSLFPCCHMVYDHRMWITIYSKDDSMYFLADVLVNSLSVLTMVLCYGAILVKVRRSHKSTRQYAGVASNRRTQPNKRELRLFLQFFVVSLVFLATFVTWQWLPRIAASKWVYFVCTSMFFVNNAVNPTVYLIYNVMIRQEITNLLCGCCKAWPTWQRNGTTLNASDENINLKNPHTAELS